VIGPRGPLAARRVTAHSVVLIAAALTTLVAAAVGAALAVFAGQALPQAVRHDLSVAPGTSLTAQASVGGSQMGQVTSALRQAIGSAIHPVPFGFWQASWSNPLGLVPGKLPGPPPSAGRGNTPIVEVAAMQGVADHAVLLSGHWPAGAAGTGGAGRAGGAAGIGAAGGVAGAGGTGGAVQAAVPAPVAALLHVSVGEVLHLHDRVSGASATFQVTGLFSRRQEAAGSAAYWNLDSLPASGSSTLGGFTTYGPLVVDAAAFGSRLAVGSGTWFAQPDMAAFTGTDLSAVAGQVGALRGYVSNAPGLDGMQLTTALPTVLAGTASDLAVARSLLVISALQLFVLATAALVAVARLLVSQREGETALLTARGATRWQLTRLTAAEIVPLCGAAALAGGASGVWLARVLGGTVHAGDGTAAGGIPAHAAGTWVDALIAAAVIGLLACVAMLVPVLRAGPGAARVRRGRQGAVAAATRAGADLGLVVLAVLAGWQLRRYSAVTASAAGNGATASIDPVLVLAPALALAGGTVVMLRLLPAAARAGDRLAARGRGLTASMAGWQFSRQPLRQGGAALLLVMAVATGTLALAQHQSWTRSADDQAAFATGADLRVDLASPLPAGQTSTVTHAPGVRGAMAVSVLPVAVPSEVVAIGAGQAPGVALLRGDEASLPAARLFAAIAPRAGTGGTALSGTPAAIELTATLSPARLSPFVAQMTVIDAKGAAYQIPAGTLPADGRPHLLSAPLGGSLASYPLRLAQVSLDYVMPARKTKPLTLTVTGARLGGWAASASSPELDSLLTSSATIGPSADPDAIGWQPAARGGTLTFGAGYGQAAANPGFTPPGPAEPVNGQVTLTAGGVAPTVVPAIATRAFMAANDTSVGGTVPATIGGVQVPVKIVAQASTFPTVTGSALIMDLTTIQAFLASHSAVPLPVTQWWLATADHRAPAGLARTLPSGAAVTSRIDLAAATTSDPLSDAPQQALLAMAVAAALLAVCGFWVSIAADVRQRRGENALLAALGVAQRSAAAQLFLEKLLLSVPSAALGLVQGTVVARLLVPAVTLTPAAGPPVPPPVTLLDLPQTAALAAFIAVVPALAAAFVVIRRPDPAAELRATEAA
jgi:ABC-type lipoprotein release transport system permease subunit